MQNDFVEFIKIKEGDVKAFERVFRKYYTPLYNYSYSLTGQKETAEETIQDIFYIIWKNRNKINILSSLKSYLYKSVKNRALQCFEHQKVCDNHRKKVLKQKINYTEITPAEILENKEFEEFLKQTLQKLPERRLKIFNMHRFEDKKYKEIAETLSISVKTVEAEMTSSNISFTPSFHTSLSPECPKSPTEITILPASDNSF